MTNKQTNHDRSFFNMHLVLKLLTLIIILFISACSSKDEKKVCFDQNDYEDEIAQKDLENNLQNSYIVNFKLHRKYLSPNTYNHFSKQIAFSDHFADLLQQNYQVIKFSLISNLDYSWNSGFKRLSNLFEGNFSNVQSTTAITRVDFRSKTAAKILLRKWTEFKLISDYEPNFVNHLNQSNPIQTHSTEYQNINSWWLKNINLNAALKKMAEAKNINENTAPLIAILDSGVDVKHPSLIGKIWKNKNPNKTNCGNDLYGCNTTNSSKSSLGDGDIFPYLTTGFDQICSEDSSICSHGTHVAGIISANINKNTLTSATAGVCPICKVVPIKVVEKLKNDNIGILDSSILSALEYVSLLKTNHKAAIRVVNASFGKFNRSRTVKLMIDNLKQHGVIVVAAAGNENTRKREYPAAFNNVIAVSALDRFNQKESFANYGSWINISAPGKEILSTAPGGEYLFKSGTSMAAPMVSAALGLLIALNPETSFEMLFEKLVNSTDSSIYDKDNGNGLNYKCYYKNSPNEEHNKKLLGKGSLDVEKLITNF